MSGWAVFDVSLPNGKGKLVLAVADKDQAGFYTLRIRSSKAGLEPLEVKFMFRTGLEASRDPIQVALQVDTVFGLSLDDPLHLPAVSFDGDAPVVAPVRRIRLRK